MGTAVKASPTTSRLPALIIVRSPQGPAPAPARCFGAIRWSGRCGRTLVRGGYCLRCWCLLVVWAEDAEPIL